MTFIWTWLVGSKLGRAVGMAIGALGLIAGVFFAGGSSSRKDQKIKDLEDFKDTKEKIDEVDKSSNRDDAVERLRNNGWL